MLRLAGHDIEEIKEGPQIIIDITPEQKLNLSGTHKYEIESKNGSLTGSKKISKQNSKDSLKVSNSCLFNKMHEKLSEHNSMKEEKIDQNSKIKKFFRDGDLKEEIVQF